MNESECVVDGCRAVIIAFREPDGGRRCTKHSPPRPRPEIIYCPVPRCHGLRGHTPSCCPTDFGRVTERPKAINAWREESTY